MALRNSDHVSRTQSDNCGAELNPLAFRISEVCRTTGLGRTSIYAAIKSGDLIARKWKRRTIVLADDLAAFLRNLPSRQSPQEPNR
jgi:hypothetical protein